MIDAEVDECGTGHTPLFRAAYISTYNSTMMIPFAHLMADTHSRRDEMFDRLPLELQFAVFAFLQPPIAIPKFTFVPTYGDLRSVSQTCKQCRGAVLRYLRSRVSLCRQYEAQQLKEDGDKLAEHLWDAWRTDVKELEVHSSMCLDDIVSKFGNVASVTILGGPGKMGSCFSIPSGLEHLALSLQHQRITCDGRTRLRRLDIVINADIEPSTLDDLTWCCRLQELNVMASDSTNLLRHEPLMLVLPSFNHLEKLTLRKYNYSKVTSAGGHYTRMFAEDSFRILNSLQLKELSLDLIHLRGDDINWVESGPVRVDRPRLTLTIVQPTVESLWDDRDSIPLLFAMRSLSRGYRVVSLKHPYGLQTQTQLRTPTMNMYSLGYNSELEVEDFQLMRAWETVDDEILRQEMEGDHKELCSWQRVRGSSPTYRTWSLFKVERGSSGMNEVIIKMIGESDNTLDFWSTETVLSNVAKHSIERKKTSLWD